MRERSNVSSKSGYSYLYVGKRRRGKRNICVIQAVDTGTGGSVPPCSFSAGLILGVKDLASEILCLFYYMKSGSKAKEKKKKI